MTAGLQVDDVGAGAGAGAGDGAVGTGDGPVETDCAVSVPPPHAAVTTENRTAASHAARGSVMGAASAGRPPIEPAPPETFRKCRQIQMIPAAQTARRTRQDAAGLPSGHGNLVGRHDRFVGGGERGIRTPDTLSGTAVFKTAAIDHSATSPRRQLLTIPAFRPAARAAGDPV